MSLKILLHYATKCHSFTTIYTEFLNGGLFCVCLTVWMYTHTHTHTHTHARMQAHTHEDHHLQISFTLYVSLCSFPHLVSAAAVISPTALISKPVIVKTETESIMVFEDQDKRTLYKYKDSVRTSQRMRCRHTFIRKSDPRILCGKIMAVRNTQNITNTLCGHNTNGTTMLYGVNYMQDVCFRLRGYNLCYIPCQLSPRTGPAIYGMNVLLVSGNHLLCNIHCPQLVRRYDVKKLSSGSQ